MNLFDGRYDDFLCQPTEGPRVCKYFVLSGQQLGRQG
jgi:hypothetical protein